MAKLSSVGDSLGGVSAGGAFGKKPKAPKSVTTKKSDGKDSDYLADIAEGLERTRKGSKANKVKKTPPDKAKSKAKSQKGQPCPGTDDASLFLGEVFKQMDKKSLIPVAPRKSLVSIGIKIPFMLQYLFHSSCLPLGLEYELAGEPDNNKSTLLFEFIRMFNDAGGAVHMHEVESKISPQLFASVVGYDDEKKINCKIIECDHMDDWQRSITTYLNNLKKFGNAKEGRKKRGISFPVLLAVDSIMGKSLKVTGDNIDKQGFASQAHPLEALSLTNYMKRLSSRISDMPVAAFFVNHLKPKPNARVPGVMDDATPGGKQVKFQCSYRIKVKRIGQKRYVDTSSDGGLDINTYTLQLSSMKNSMGESKRAIQVPVSWRYVRHGRYSRQRTTFHWGASLASFLCNSFEGSRKDRVRGVVDISAATEGRFYSKRLGVSKKAPISGDEIGQMIEDDQEIVEALRQLFGIVEAVPFVVGQNYSEMYSSLICDKIEAINGKKGGKAPKKAVEEDEDEDEDDEDDGD